MKYKTRVTILQFWLNQSDNKLIIFSVQRNEGCIPFTKVSGKTNIIYLLLFSSVMWPPTVYELLVWPQGLFGWPPDHMGWFALLLLVKFKTPCWFYFISYSCQVVHFGGWEHCVKVWWVTRSKSKVSRPLFSLVLDWAGVMICLVVNKGVCEADYMHMHKILILILWANKMYPIIMNNLVF